MHDGGVVLLDEAPLGNVDMLTTLTWTVSLEASPMGGNWGIGGEEAPAGITICAKAETAMKKKPAPTAGTIVRVNISFSRPPDF